MVNQRPPPRELLEDLSGKDLKQLTRLLRRPNGEPIDSTWLVRQKKGVDLLPKKLRRLEGIVGTVDNIVKYRVEKATLCGAHKRLQPWLIRRIFTQITLEITSRNERMSKNGGMRLEVYQWLKGVHSLNSLMMKSQFFRQMFREDFDYTDWRPDMIKSGCEACIISYIGGSAKALQDLTISAQSRKTRNHEPPLLCKVLNSYIDDLSEEEYTRQMYKANVEFIKEIKHIRQELTKVYRENKRLEREKRKHAKVEKFKSRSKTAPSDPFNDPDYVERKCQDIRVQDQEENGESMKRSEFSSEEEIAHFYAERFSTAGLNCAPEAVFDGRGLHPVFRQSYRLSIMTFSDIQGVGGPYRESMAPKHPFNFDTIAENEASAPNTRASSRREERSLAPMAETVTERPQSMSSVYSRNAFGISYSRLPNDDEPPIVPPLPLKFGGDNPKGYDEKSLSRAPTDNSSSEKPTNGGSSIPKPSNGSVCGRGGFAGVAKWRNYSNPSSSANPSNSSSSSTKTSAYRYGGYAEIADSHNSPKTCSSTKGSSPNSKPPSGSAYRGAYAGLRDSRNFTKADDEKKSTHSSGSYAGINRNAPAPSSSYISSPSSQSSTTNTSRGNSSSPSSQQKSAYGLGGYAGISSRISSSRTWTANQGHDGRSNAQNTRTATSLARSDSGPYATGPSIPYTLPQWAPQQATTQTESDTSAPAARESIWVDDMVESDESDNPPPPREEGFELPDVDDYTQMVENERNRIRRWSDFN